MLQRNTIIVVIVFAVVVVAAIFIQRQAGNTPPEGDLPTAVPTRFLFELDTNSVDHLQVESSTGQNVAFQKADDLWSAVKPPAPAQDTDQTQLASTISQLTTIRVMNELENPPLLDVMGLDTPDYVITFSMAQDERKIDVGDESPIGNGYYVRVNRGAPKLVDKVVLDRFISFLDTPPIIPTPTITPTVGVSTTLTVTPTLDITPTDLP